MRGKDYVYVFVDDIGEAVVSVSLKGDSRSVGLTSQDLRLAPRSVELHRDSNTVVNRARCRWQTVDKLGSLSEQCSTNAVQSRFACIMYVLLGRRGTRHMEGRQCIYLVGPESMPKPPNHHHQGGRGVNKSLDSSGGADLQSTAR